MQDAAHFQDLFKSVAFFYEPVIVAAVSGGSDSTALLFQAKEAIARAGTPTRLVAVTIDHGLRSESADEAAWVGLLCVQHGIEHRTVRWTGDKPTTGIQSAARLARYRLLADAAIEVGSRLVLTGHTADDQAETIAMRGERGTGIGLAGIAPATLFDGAVWFARLQLESRREVLRGFLRERGIGWIDDPSNANRDFERVRVRQGMSAANDGDFQRTIEAGERTATARIDAGRRAARLIKDFASRAAPDALSVDAGFANAGDAEGAVHALRILLAVAGATDHLPDLLRTSDLLKRLSAAERGRFSLSRVVVTCRKGEILLKRERRGQAAQAPGTGDNVLRSPWSLFLPSFDLEPARAVADLLGKPPPALPWP